MDGSMDGWMVGGKKGGWERTMNGDDRGIEMEERTKGTPPIFVFYDLPILFLLVRLLALAGRRTLRPLLLAAIAGCNRHWRPPLLDLVQHTLNNLALATPDHRHIVFAPCLLRLGRLFQKLLVVLGEGRGRKRTMKEESDKVR